jgi:hypothetical protein
VERLLTELGAMTEEQLLVGLRNAGVDLGHDPAETLADLLDGDELRAGDLVGFRVTTAGMDITASTRATSRPTSTWGRVHDPGGVWRR